MRRHLAPAGIRIVLGADAGEQHLERRHPELQAQRAIAIVREEPVVTGFQAEPRGHEHGFVSRAAYLKEDVALVLELDFLVIELARQEHAAMDGEQLRRAEAREIRRLGRRGASVLPVQNGLHLRHELYHSTSLVYAPHP